MIKWDNEVRSSRREKRKRTTINASILWRNVQPIGWSLRRIPFTVALAMNKSVLYEFTHCIYRHQMCNRIVLTSKRVRVEGKGIKHQAHDGSTKPIEWMTLFNIYQHKIGRNHVNCISIGNAKVLIANRNPRTDKYWEMLFPCPPSLGDFFFKFQLKTLRFSIASIKTKRDYMKWTVSSSSHRYEKRFVCYRFVGSHTNHRDRKVDNKKFDKQHNVKLDTWTKSIYCMSIKAHPSENDWVGTGMRHTFSFTRIVTH